MTLGLFTNVDVEFTDPTGLPTVVDYPAYFAAQASLLGWFDLSQSDIVTLASGKVSAVDARLGALSLAQADEANRPTYDAGTGRLLFASASAQFLTGVGNFPTTAVTIAAILRRAADATATEGVIGATTPAPGSHSLFFQSNGELRFRVTDGTLTTFGEPADPTPPTGENVLVLATYDQATDQALCRFGDGGDGDTFVAGGDITMNTGWNVGALTSGGGSPANFELADLFVFNAAHLSDDVATHLISYARDVKGAA